MLQVSDIPLQRIPAERLRRSGPMILTARDGLQEALVGMLAHLVSLKERAHFFATLSLTLSAAVIDRTCAGAAE